MLPDLQNGDQRFTLAITFGELIILNTLFKSCLLKFIKNPSGLLANLRYVK